MTPSRTMDFICERSAIKLISAFTQMILEGIWSEVMRDVIINVGMIPACTMAFSLPGRYDMLQTIEMHPRRRYSSRSEAREII